MANEILLKPLVETAGDAGGYQVRILKSAQEIEGFRKVWETWSGHLYADIDFFLTVVEARKPLATPHVIVISIDDVPKSMAVGYLAESQLDFKVSHKSLFRTRLKTFNVIRGGLLGDQSAEISRAVFSALWKILKRGEADALVMGHTRLDSPFFQIMQKETSFFCRDHALEIWNHWKMAVPDSMEAIYAGLTGDHRKKLRWQNKNFEKNFPGTLTVHCFKEAAELEKMTRDVEAISKKTYQRSLGSCFIDNETNRKRVALEAEKGWLRMYVLYDKATPIAYWWGELYNQTFYSEAMGYDPEYRRFSPGTYLLTKTLEDFCRSGVKDLDFGAGDYLYKRQFGSQSWEETQVFYVFAPKVRPICLNLLRTLVGGFRFSARKAVKLFRTLEFLRKPSSHKIEKSPACPLNESLDITR